MRQPDYEAFFTNYADVFNRSMQGKLDADVVYMLQRREGGPKIFAFVAGDEMGIYRRYGLVDEQGRPV
jgi:hypothetical protein